MNLKDVRWEQRFENFEKAFSFFKRACKKKNYSPLEASGLVKAFEFTFELAWKTLKDYLEMTGIDAKFPRDVIKQSYNTQLIEDGHRWMLMLEKRNELSHTYDQKEADKAVAIIKSKYFSAVEQVYKKLKQRIDEQKKAGIKKRRSGSDS